MLSYIKLSKVSQVQNIDTQLISVKNNVSFVKKNVKLC